MSAGTPLPGTPTPMHYWTGAAGVRIAGDAWGPPDGPLVLLQHGGGQTRHAWKGACETLGAAGYRAVAFDARTGRELWRGGAGPGHGAPPPAPLYASTEAVEQAILIVSVEIFQSVVAAGGQIEGVDFQPSPFRMGRSLNNRVIGLLGSYVDVENMAM